MEIGQRWGYRARGADPLVEVEVLKLGTQKPARALVRFVDESFEGREEWVPPARLKVAWDGAPEFEAREARWDAVDTHPGLDESPTDYAIGEVFEAAIDVEIAEPVYRYAGVTSIRNASALAARLQLDEAVLRADPLAFEDEGALIVPWATTEQIVRRTCDLYADAVLQAVAKDEEEARRESTHGYTVRFGRNDEGRFVTPVEAAARDTEWPFRKKKRDLLRQWCGSEAADRQDELRALREEVVRLDLLVGDAIRVLRTHGLDTPADQLQRQFGVPLSEARDSRR